MRFSIRHKIQVTVISIILGVSLSIYLFFNSQQVRLLEEEFIRSSHSLAVTVALGIQIGLEVGDFTALERAVDFAKSDNQVRFVVVREANGETLAAYPRDYSIDDTPNGADIHAETVPFESEELSGEVVLGRQMTAYYQKVREMRIVLFGVCVVAFILGSAGAIVLARKVSDPIYEIRQAAYWVGQGDLESRVDIRSNDELGDLGGAFNKMVEDIRRYLDAAQDATRAKSEFLASMSHEIRTPMNGVIGMTSLLSETELDGEQRDYVETIRSSGDSLLTIINDILDFSKIEAGQLELEEHEFEFRACVEDVIDILAFKAAEKRIELASLIMPEVPAFVLGDSTRLRQIIMNLVGNAIKFTSAGEVVVTAELEESTAEEIVLHISVRDTGIGIPADRLGRLFKSFSQVDSSTTRKYGGTGLGLVISKQLCELMGGKIWVESEEDVGSTFHFTARVRKSSHDRLPGMDSCCQEKKALIVDDNATNRKILLLQLGSWGIEAEAVSSGPEALQQVLDGKRYDLYVLDYQMPLMDGLTLARLLENSLGAEAAPMLLLSSMGTRFDIQDAPFAAALTKPVRESQLQYVIRNMLNQNGTIVESQNTIESLEASDSPLRILLADDNMINQKVLQRLLDQIGYTADLAGNGLEVIDILKYRNYDVVLMDVQMPEMDGIAATRWIRTSLPPDQQPYIIAVTANTSLDDRNDCLSAGMNDFIEKPVKVNHLKAAIRAHQKRSTPRAAEESPLIEAQESD